MAKEDFFSKLNIKDYNNELEDILENKSFSEGTKNILLNILYKIETAYADYNKVKVNTKSKKDFLEEVINIIKYNCNEIEIVKIKLNEETKLGDKKFIVQKDNKKIISYPSEKTVFYALYHLADKKFIINNDYYIIKEPMEDLLNQGYIMDKEEIIRDFDGWTWNIEKKEIEHFIYNIIYQNIKILFDNTFLQNIIENKDSIDFVKESEKKINEEYDTEISESISKLIYQIAILVNIKNNIEKKNKILEAKEAIKKELNKMGNKKVYLQDIADLKKEVNKQIKKIDEVISNNRLLREDFIEENKTLDEKDQIFSLSEYSDVLQKRREDLLKQIDYYSMLMKPMNFVQKKTELEKKNLILSVVEENNDTENQIFNLLKELQIVFLKALQEKINKIESKKEIQNYIYLLRYYKLLPVNNENQIKDVNEIATELRKN